MSNCGWYRQVVTMKQAKVGLPAGSRITVAALESANTTGNIASGALTPVLAKTEYYCSFWDFT
jgi:hypothetical protein